MLENRKNAYIAYYKEAKNPDPAVGGYRDLGAGYSLRIWKPSLFNIVPHGMHYKDIFLWLFLKKF